MHPPSQPEQEAIVLLPTATVPSYFQTVVGKRSPVSDDIEEFRGLPYAHVPGRWEHSRLRDTAMTNECFDWLCRPRCPTPGQPDSSFFQSYLPFPNDREDEFECLNLLVVRPSKAALAKHGLHPKKSKLPVLVWIHGGGFADGAATSPVYEAFIMVAINYRLNIFGFGASSDMLAAQSSQATIKGVNFGLRDQKLALIWIQRNIAAFGGDADKVTIMGHSAAAISCHIHLLEAELDTKKPLFRKAFMLSGAWGGLDFRSLEKADERWADLCRLWAVRDESPIDRLNLLKRIPAKDLVRSVSDDLHWRFFVMVIDELTIRKSNLNCEVSFHFGHDEMDNQVKGPSDEPIQVVFGTASHEFSGFVRMANWDYDKFRSLLVTCFPLEAAAENVLRAYNILPTTSADELFEGFVQYISDATMCLRVHRAGSFLKAHREQQALLYGKDQKRVGVQYCHFEFGNPFLGPSDGIAHHGVELIYLFGTFREALEKADQGVLEGYIDPSQEAADVAPPPQASPSARGMKYSKSNIDLSNELQDKLIQFIVEDNEETAERANADEITTFCPDRSTRVENWTSTEKWRAREKRYEILEEDMGSMLAATRKLVGSVLDMTLE
ncbi:alpha/beta-hydrolase [Trichoderma longibrachiatum ATCC 18648]|uniref:Alpha/beta-hydrolase n=1 Tax=Trichoderma longibrachiatum ATCC 18648 TaxID=983965 RepID=A0A2T4BS39_TRILO|nr:alpha/beta-hydrolase [Trichoderma longibrachiatum ATCC 18648]